jgi:hypothetical protein
MQPDPHPVRRDALDLQILAEADRLHLRDLHRTGALRGRPRLGGPRQQSRDGQGRRGGRFEKISAAGQVCSWLHIRAGMIIVPLVRSLHQQGFPSMQRRNFLTRSMAGGMAAGLGATLKPAHGQSSSDLPPKFAPSAHSIPHSPYSPFTTPDCYTFADDLMIERNLPTSRTRARCSLRYSRTPTISRCSRRARSPN